MVYVPKNLSLVNQGMVGPKRWVYVDTGTTHETNYGDVGFFSDAKDRGMDTGDRVEIFERAGKTWVLGAMTTVQDTGATSGTFLGDTG